MYAVVHGTLTRATSRVNTPCRAADIKACHALADFGAVHVQDSDSTEVKEELQETMNLINERNNDDDYDIEFDPAFPSLVEIRVRVRLE